MPGACRTGDVVLGRYRVDGDLGRGAAGFSYKGTDLETEDPVVIKELPGEFRDQLGRFQGETAVLRDLRGSFVDEEGIARLVHPIDSGAQHDRAYTVRPFVPGKSLRQLLAAGPLSAGQVRPLFGDLLRALMAAHQENLVHRNLKPENVFVDSAGRARITGVGTGCFLTRARREELGVDLGGLRYVAPEQLLDARRVDRRTDLFSLGLMLYEALTGGPFVAARDVPGAVGFLSVPFEGPDRDPGGLAEVAARMVQFHLERRPAEAAVLLPSISPWQGESPGATACEGCASPVPGHAAYCLACGRAMRGPCPHCGAAVPSRATFCRSCGSRVDVAPGSRLVGLVGSFRGEVLALPEDGSVRLGRARECSISFENRDQYVSRHQAEMSRRRGRWWVTGGDWTSGRPTTNGTLLNGRNLDGQGAVLLLDGDRLRVGDSFFRFEERAA